MPPASSACLGTDGTLVDGDTAWLLTAREPGDHAMFAVSMPAADLVRADLSRVRAVDASFRGQTELSGFGDAPITLRTARAPAGPWSAPSTIFRAPEGGTAGALVYSAKAHQELVAPGGALVVTSCTNDASLATLVDDTRLYFPRFLRVHLAAR